MSDGHLDILNCHDGHMKLTFEKDDPTEVERAKRVIRDMLRRGYSLFIEHEGRLVPVRSFNEKTACYIIAAGPTDQQESYREPKKQTKKKSRKKSVPIRKAKATAIAPTAGG